MLDNKIGYIICETASQPSEAKIVSEKNNRVTIEAILQDMEVKNRNGRYYAKSELEPALKSERITSLLQTGNLFGEMGHPLGDISRQQCIDPTNVCHRILSLEVKGNDIIGMVKGTPNQKGEDFNNFILDGSKVAFSLRALGSVTNTKRGAEVRNINIITWDFVIYQSHRRAEMQRIVSESTGYTQTESKIYIPDNDKGIFKPITNKQVMNYIKTESANINNVLKSFDTLYESATLIDNGSRVQLSTSTGDILVINLESYIQNEIMDFCSK